MDIVLVAGLWLDAGAWAEVVPELEVLGHRAVPVTLPGQGDGAASATFEDQVGAVVAAVDAAEGRPVVVGHSAASALAWAAADARPEKVARVVMIGGFSPSDGEPYADIAEPEGGVVPFPGWEPFEGPDVADLDQPTRERFAATAIPVPVAVTRGLMRLRDPRRYDVPVTLVCPEFTPAQATMWIEAGEVPELAAARHLELVDLDTGHWPMFSAPRELARTLAALTGPTDVT